MKAFAMEDGRRVPLSNMSIPQTKQSIAIMDCIGRMIPQEGVDYDVEITFNGVNDPSVSMRIEPHTDKGKFWEGYVMEMIRKYPPTIENPPQSIEGVDFGKEAVDEEKLP